METNASVAVAEHRIIPVTGSAYARQLEHARKEYCYDFELDENHDSTEHVIRDFVPDLHDAMLALQIVKWAQAKGATHVILNRHRQTGAVSVKGFVLVA